MNLNEVFQAAHGRVAGWADYAWPCFGNQAKFIDFGVEGQGTASCVFNLNTLRVYALEVFDEANGRAWRWLDPETASLYLSECEIRRVNHQVAWDDVVFETLNQAGEALLLLDQLIPMPDTTNDLT